MDNCEISQLSKKNFELDDVWRDLEAGLIYVYENKCLPKNNYAQLYSHIYNCCSIKKPKKEWCHSSSRKYENKKKNYNNADKSFALQIYERFEEYINQHVINLFKNLVVHQTEDYLKFYVTHWKDFQTSSQIWNDVCRYMNRYWIKNEVENGQTRLCVYQLALKAWKTHVFMNLNIEVCWAVLKLIARERNGESIDERMICCIINSFIEIGLLKNEEGENLDVYREHFEKIFLEETERFYIQKEIAILKNTTVTEYMKKVEDILQEEESKVCRYLHKSTRYELIKICDNILIGKHLDFIQSDFVTLLENGSNRNLGRMYSLLYKVSDGLKELVPLFEKHVKARGLCAVEECCKTALNPKIYVDAILEVYEKYQCLISSSFDNHKYFLTALDKACCSFVNSNAVTKMAGSSSESAILLIKYCDILLKKSKNCLEVLPLLKNSLNRVTSIFKYVADKDLFVLNYGKMLAKRLVEHVSINDEYEVTVIANLMAYFGSDYTTNLERMLEYNKESKSLAEAFQAGLTESCDPYKIGFTAQVFAYSDWPLEKSIAEVISLPLEFKTSITLFDSFYREIFTNRKLSWWYSLSTGEIQTNCFENTYTLQVSTFEMAVLLQYNIEKSWKIKQLVVNTQLKLEVIVDVVKGLVHEKLLTCEDDYDLSAESLVSLVSDYKNDEPVVNFFRSLEVESKVNVEASQRQTELSRKFQIQAAVVRIMKRERTMEQSELLTAVESQLSLQFRPSHDMILQCINGLVEKDYLEQFNDDICFYTYVL